MNDSVIAPKKRALKGAIARAKRLPKANRNEFNHMASSWDHGTVWLGDWGKSESDFKPSQGKSSVKKSRFEHPVRVFPN